MIYVNDDNYLNLVMDILSFDIRHHKPINLDATATSLVVLVFAGDQSA